MREDAVDSQKGLETILKLFVGDEQVAALLVCRRRRHTYIVLLRVGARDYNGLSQEDRETEFYRYRETERRMNERRKFLAERCSEEGLDRPGNDSLHRPNAWEFLVNREHHLIWCNVFKAASTSWMYNFNLLAGYSPQFLKASKAVPVSLARQKYPRPTADELARYLNDSVSFLIVRHPFERLLSAYRDKLEHSLPHTFHSKLGSHIVSHYRLKSTKSGGKHGPRYPLFEEFVRWLLCEWKAGNELDMHWTPIVNFCTPCQVRFNVIVKFETLHVSICIHLCVIYLPDRKPIQFLC
uniref:Carbohydrate sulfotransferase n=1 Tax=Trichogramma kaykai TaxID=54128 RepID=A0ABD2VT55_9HYME